MEMNEILCGCNNVTNGDIIKAMAKGATTFEDIQEATGAGTGCGGCLGDIVNLMEAVVCRCKQVSVKDVTDAILSGSETLDEVIAKTSATTGCGRCKGTVEEIVALAK